jgi:hypothetical protein
MSMVFSGKLSISNSLNGIRYLSCFFSWCIVNCVSFVHASDLFWHDLHSRRLSWSFGSILLVSREFDHETSAADRWSLCVRRCTVLASVFLVENSNTLFFSISVINCSRHTHFNSHRLLCLTDCCRRPIKTRHRCNPTNWQFRFSFISLSYLENIFICLTLSHFSDRTCSGLWRFVDYFQYCWGRFVCHCVIM